jgi:arylsulfatase A-like enzyme
VIGSDHGQGFMEHKQMYHNMFPYNELVHVPLITARYVDGKQVREGERVHNNVSTTRLYDSMLDIAYGKSDVINGSMRRDDYVFADHTGISEVWDTYLLHLFSKRSQFARSIYGAKLHYNTFSTAVYRGRYKLISYAGNRIAPELYDMAEDPMETENILGEKRAIALELLRADRKHA